MPFATPGNGLRIADLEGALIVVQVNKLERGIQSAQGGDPYDALDCDVHICDGPHAGKTEPGMRISAKVLLDQLGHLLDTREPLLGRVVLITTGRRPYRKLATVNAEDVATALRAFPQFADNTTPATTGNAPRATETPSQRAGGAQVSAKPAPAGKWDVTGEAPF